MYTNIVHCTLLHLALPIPVSEVLTLLLLLSYQLPHLITQIQKQLNDNDDTNLVTDK